MADDLGLFEFLEVNLRNAYSTSQRFELELCKEFIAGDGTQSYGDNNTLGDQVSY